MPKRSTPFQRLVLLLKDSLSDSVVKVTESKDLVDRVTGRNREVDVVLEAQISGSPIIVSVEVVDRERKADSTWVESMLKKHEDLPTNHLVLVSRAGFYAPAREKALHAGAEALSADEAESVDWPLAVRLLDGGTFELTRFHYTCSALLGDEKAFRPISCRTVIKLPYRDDPTDIQAMVNYFLAEPRLREPIIEHLRSTPERKYWLEYPAQEGMETTDGIPLRKLRVAMEVEFTRTPMEYSMGRLDGHDFLQGTATDSATPLTMAFFRDATGKISGRLLEGDQISPLTVEPAPSDDC